MHDRPPVVQTLLLALCLLWAIPGHALAQQSDTWRLAGTFNGWNASDDGWRMEPHPDRSWIFRLERLLEPGSYRFKFVRNGDWNDQHFGGAAERASALEQPGQDILLDVPGLGFYAFELNTQDRTWSLSVASVDRPIVLGEWFGSRQNGTTHTLLLAASITNTPLSDIDQVSARFLSTPSDQTPSLERTAPDRFAFTPSDAGLYTVEVSVTDGDAQTVERFELEVDDRKAPDAQDPNLVVFEHQGDLNTLRVELVGEVASVLRADQARDLMPWAVHGQTTVFKRALHVPEGAFSYGFRINGGLEIADTSEDSARLSPTRSRLIVGPTPSDFAPAKTGAIVREGIRFDPESVLDFNPISDGLGLVDVSLRTLPGDASAAALVFYTVDPEDGILAPNLVPMLRSDDPTGFDRWSARVQTGSPEFEYEFLIFDLPARITTARYSASLKPDPRLDLPDWAKGAVYYQIFAERFRNGNPANDPHGPGVFAMPWNSDWYRNQPGEEEQWRIRAGLTADEPLPTRQGGDLFHWVWDRRYGGDLQGVVEKLDYIQALGIDAIYFNPVFEGDSMHKYDATAFHHIDDNFGAPGSVPAFWEHTPDLFQDNPATWQWTEADRYFLDVLLPEARKRDIRIVIDGVWNHTGRNFWAWQDILRQGANSPYADWFYVNFADDGSVESWQAWDGPNGWLPKFRQTATGDLIPPVKKHIEEVTRRWMDPNGDGDPSDGVDGWRLDVPLDIGLPFWEDWRELVKSINPDAVIIAEIWQPADPYLTGKHFDTQMHYPFAMAVIDWLGVQPGMTSRELGNRLKQAFNDSPQTNLIHQNLFGSHDTDRFVSMLINPGRSYDQGNRPQDNGPNYLDVRPDQRTYALSLLGLAIQATYTGAPMVYYGDEVGMWGADDPTNRKPMPWPDRGPYESSDDRFDEDLLADYTRWLQLRHDDRIGPALRYGSVGHLETGNPDVFAFERRLNAERVVVVINRGEEPFDAAEILPAGTADTIVNPISARHWAQRVTLKP